MQDVPGWELVDGSLIITGSGPMRNYEQPDHSPWYSRRNEVKRIVVSEGITHIGDLAFCDCDNVVEVCLPKSLLSIGEWAFFDCDGLMKVSLRNSVTFVGAFAFSKCDKLQAILDMASLKTVDVGAFKGCKSLLDFEPPKHTQVLYGALMATPLSAKQKGL